MTNGSREVTRTRQSPVQGSLSKKRVNGGNPAVAGNDEISPGVSWRVTGAARYPLDAPAIAQFLSSCNGLILKIRMSGLVRGVIRAWNFDDNLRAATRSRLQKVRRSYRYMHLQEATYRA